MIDILFNGVTAVCAALASFYAVLQLQLGGYKLQKKVFRINYVFSLILAQALLMPFFFVWQEIAWCFSCIAHVAVFAFWYFKKRKLRFVLTKRAFRLFCAVFVLHFATYCISDKQLFPLLCLPVTVLANYLLLPVETAINFYYVTKANKRLLQSGVKVIAIVGSYGKTSVKNIACVLLPDSVCTPKSVNTPLGIAAFINKTDLSRYKHFLVEMGARRQGDIRKLCLLTRPSIGVMTGLADCHISTFGDIKSVISAKSELLEYLSSENVCVLNGKDDLLRGLSEIGECRKIYSDDVVSVEDVKTYFDKTVFTLTYGEDSVKVFSELLGAGNVANVQLCVTLATTMGFDFVKVCKNVEKLKQTEHRLSLTQSNGIYVLDDSYNANLYGVKQAADTLRLFKGKKHAVCQGIAEGGVQSEKQNSEVGRIMSNAVDFLYATGENKAAILKGASGGKACCFECKDLTTAMITLKQYIDNGDVVYFQNDMP